jgi:hypothetical protein
LEEEATARAEDVEEDVEEVNKDNTNASKYVDFPTCKSPTYKSPTYESPSPINSPSTTEPTTEPTMEPTAVEVVQKRKDEKTTKNRKAKKAKKT